MHGRGQRKTLGSPGFLPFPYMEVGHLIVSMADNGENVVHKRKFVGNHGQCQTSVVKV